MATPSFRMVTVLQNYDLELQFIFQKIIISKSTGVLCNHYCKLPVTIQSPFRRVFAVTIQISLSRDLTAAPTT